MNNQQRIIEAKYILVEWQDHPLAVEIVQEGPKYAFVISLEGERSILRKIHKQKTILFDTFEEAERARITAKHINPHQECDQ